MNSLKDLTLKDYDCIPLTNKTTFWDTFRNVDTPKYRTIPVCKTIDAMTVTGISIENVSGVKELEKFNSFNRRNTFNAITNPSPNSNKHPKISKTLNVNATKFNNNTCQQGDSIHSLLDRLEQGSWSEPTLPVAKDRGDSLELQDLCREGIGAFQNNFKRRLSDRKSLLSKKRIVKGCIYIKNVGNIYKSEIEAKSLQGPEKDIFRNFPGARELSHNTKSKKMLGKSIFGKNSFKFQTDEMGDFEIAIYLSGSMNADEKHQKQNVMEFERMSESKVQHERVKNKKKPHVNKSSNTPYGKSYEIMNQAQTRSSKLQKSKKCDTDLKSRCKTRLTYQINKRNVALDLSGDDSDAEYELNESGNIISKRKVNEVIGDNSNDVRNSFKPSDSGGLSYRSRKSGTMSSRSRIMSQSSLSRYSVIYGIQKPKITEEEIWENFEMIFKSYASTTRHSGEVIPRKISTEWMINTGVVNELMTQHQADNAFRRVAGTKITMNAQEYKDFLINLSLKMKLPYYEIYRRMCGM